MSRDQQEREILVTFAEHGPLHVMEVAQKVDNHPLSVDRACARLYDGGHISPFSHGYYRLTDHGQQRLTDNCDLYQTSDQE
jgi:predicted transcriptional regulator